MGNVTLPPEVQEFIESLKEMNWMDNHGKLPGGILLFDTREAAIVPTTKGQAQLVICQLGTGESH